ncbi:hypothetical protein KC853_01240 [Candidatus Saccharibacteria bacterium]|nr:hypothetical protein [Candidatus Saccharibacteria bacterium]
MIEETISDIQARSQVSPELGLDQSREQVTATPEVNTGVASSAAVSTSVPMPIPNIASPVASLTGTSQTQPSQLASLPDDDQELTKQFIDKAEQIISDLATKPRDEEIAESGLNSEYLKAKGLDIKQDQ